VATSGRRIYADHAARTTVRGNTLQHLTYGVRIEDDDALVEQNRFVSADAGTEAVLVGTNDRTTVSAHPVRRAVVRDNTATIDGNPIPYRAVYAHEATTFTGNTASGAPAALVPGAPPLINPFLFVKDFWLVP
jgi:hypothetical protein